MNSNGDNKSPWNNLRCMETSHNVSPLFSLWLHLDFLLPKRHDFGDFDVLASEVITEHSRPGVSFYLPLKKYLDSGECILNPHQNNNNPHQNNNNASSGYKTKREELSDGMDL